MKPTPSGFASYVKKQTVMNPISKKRMKKELMEFYGSVHGASINGTQSIFTFLFQGNMTFAKLAVYIIASLTVSTGVYAGLAPESFAKTSASVKAGVVAALDSTLEIVGIKTETKADVDANVDVHAGTKNDESTTKKGFLQVIFGSDSSTVGSFDKQGSIDTNTTSNTNLKANIDANVNVGVDTSGSIDEVDTLVDNALDTVGSIDVEANAVIGSSTTTNTQNTNTQADTSLEGQVNAKGDMQGTTTIVKEEKDTIVEIIKEVNPTLDASSKTSTQGSVGDSSNKGTINTATENENTIGLDL